jgi:ankyrin repeat protein
MPTSAGKEEDWFEKERLHFAAADGDTERVKELLQEGYPINAFDDSLRWTPLYHAAVGEHMNVVRYLIEAGADVDRHHEERIGETVLGEIAGNCSLEMATILVDAGADPTIPGWMGITALDTSAKRKKPEGKEVHRLLCDAAKRRKPR